MINSAALRRAWFLPLFVVQGYLSVVLLFYFIGPWPWAHYNTGLLVAYLLAAQACIALGYIAAWPRVQAAADKFRFEGREHAIAQALKFFDISFWIFLVMLVPTSMSRAGSVIPDVLTGIEFAGAVYNANYERLTGGGNPFVIVEYARIALSPFLVGFYPLLVIFWNRIVLWKRIVGTLMVLFFVAIYIATGTNKGVADFILLLPCFMLLGKFSASGGLKFPRWIFRALFIALFIGFLVFFGRGQEGREGGVATTGTFNSGLVYVRADSGWLADVLPPSQRIAYESLVRYMTSGYYALSLAFDVDHEPTYGVGNSMFLAGQADAIAGGTYFTSQSIPGQMEQQFGFPQFALWHSIYPWLASDVGFIGALLMVGGFAYLLALSWGVAIIRLDVRYIIMLSLMIVLFLYVPANNQIFQSGETCAAFFGTLAWIILGGRRSSGVAAGRVTA